MSNKVDLGPSLKGKEDLCPQGVNVRSPPRPGDRNESCKRSRTAHPYWWTHQHKHFPERLISRTRGISATITITCSGSAGAVTTGGEFSSVAIGHKYAYPAAPTRVRTHVQARIPFHGFRHNTFRGRKPSGEYRARLMHDDCRVHRRAYRWK